jgi:hypothetical protein
VQHIEYPLKGFSPELFIPERLEIIFVLAALVIRRMVEDCFQSWAELGYSRKNSQWEGLSSDNHADNILVSDLAYTKFTPSFFKVNQSKQ